MSPFTIDLSDSDFDLNPLILQKYIDHSVSFFVALILLFLLPLLTDRFFSPCSMYFLQLLSKGVEEVGGISNIGHIGPEIGKSDINGSG